MLTRARRGLIVVGNAFTLNKAFCLAGWRGMMDVDGLEWSNSFFFVCD